MPIGDLLAQITGEPSPTQPPGQMSLPPKRKADNQLGKSGGGDKVQKISTTTANSSRPIQTQPAKSSTVEREIGRMKLSSAPRPIGSSSATTPIKNGQSTPPLSNGPSKPPKKGSFAEIMARGKAAQSTLGQVGKIQHKKIEKIPSKREREEMKALKGKRLEKNLAPGSKFSKIQHQVTNGKNGVRTNEKPAEPVPEKKVKKAALATTGYAGTARPKPGGPSKSSSSASRNDRGSDRYRDDRRPSGGARYAYISEEEEEEEDEEEEDGYGTDVSSDMEAAAFEVDEEEETAEKIARREDAEALREENRLKREKEEKRRRLAALAKARR